MCSGFGASLGSSELGEAAQFVIDHGMRDGGACGGRWRHGLPSHVERAYAAPQVMLREKRCKRVGFRGQGLDGGVFTKWKYCRSTPMGPFKWILSLT